MSKMNHEKVNKMGNVSKEVLPEIRFSKTDSGGFKIQVVGDVDAGKFLRMVGSWLSKQHIEKVGWPTIYFTPK